MSDKLRWKFMYAKKGRSLVSKHNQHEEWQIGKWRHLEDVPLLCSVGFHCSKRAADAFSYIQGDVIARVAVNGVADIGGDKEAYQSMKVVKAYRWTERDSRELAIFAAEQVLHLYEGVHPGDTRPRDAIRAARDGLNGGSAPVGDIADAAYDAACAAAYIAYGAAHDAVTDAGYATAFAYDAASYAAHAAAYAGYATAYANVAGAAVNAYCYAARAAKAAPKDGVKFHNAIEAWMLERIKTLEEL